MVVKTPEGDTFPPESRWRFNVMLPADRDRKWKEWVREKFEPLILSKKLRLRIVDWRVFTCKNNTWNRYTIDGAKDPKQKGIFPHIPPKLDKLHFPDIQSTQRLVQLKGTIGQSLEEHRDWAPSPRNYVVIVDHAVLQPRKKVPTQTKRPREFSGSVVNDALQVDPAEVEDPQPENQPSYSSNERRGLEKQAGAQFTTDMPSMADLHGDAEVDAFCALRKQLKEEPHWTIRDTHCRKTSRDILLRPAVHLDDHQLASQMYPPSSSLKRLLQLEEAVCCIIGTKVGTKASVGTGFLISPTHLMTCYHCLYNIDEVDKKTNRFSSLSPDGNFRCDFSTVVAQPSDHYVEAGEGSTVDFMIDDIIYPSDHRQRSSVGFDVAIVRLPQQDRSFIPLFQADAERYGFIESSRLRRAIQQQAHVIHYPHIKYGTTTKIQRTINVYQTTNIIGYGDWEMFHQAATTRGSSGGPIVSIDGRLLGMHRRSGAKHSVHADEGKMPRLAAQAFFNAGLRIDLFLRDSGFGFIKLPFAPAMLMHELPVVDEAVPALRQALLEVYQIPADQLRIRPDEIQPVDELKEEQMEIGHGQPAISKPGRKDNCCARCLKGIEAESQQRVDCTRCVRAWCLDCLGIKVDEAVPERWTCNIFFMRCTERSDPVTCVAESK